VSVFTCDHPKPRQEASQVKVKDGFIRLQGSLIPVKLYRACSHCVSVRVGSESINLGCFVYPGVISDSLDGPFYSLPVLFNPRSHCIGLRASSYKTLGERGGYKRCSVLALDKVHIHHFESPASDRHFRPDMYEDGDK